MGHYVTADTAESDRDGPLRKGAINGGFESPTPRPNPSVVIAVDDLQAAMKKIQEVGGRVLGDPMNIPGVGAYVSFLDTEGNRVRMLQPISRNTER